MKRLLAAFSFVLAIVGLALSLHTGQGAFYSQLCIAQEDKDRLLADKTQTEGMLFDKILFDEYALLYDEGENRLFYSLIENSSSASNPYVECISSKKNVQLAIVGWENFGTTISQEAVSGGEEPILLIYTKDEYQMVKLAFTTLPLLSVDCEGALPEDLATPMTFHLFDNRQDAVQRVVNSEGEIHIRGGWTRNFPKLGYKVTLYSDSVGNHRRESKGSLLGMRQDGDWILYAAYTDQEKIRNVFCSKLWKESCATNNRCSVDNGMEYKYVELFLNGQYWGLYALGYPIDSLQLQMTEGEYVYEKSYPVLSESDIDFNVSGAPDGYVIKEFGVNTAESWDTLKKYYQAMLYNENEYDTLRQMADIDNSIDTFLFLNMIQGVDHANVRGKNTIYNLYLTNKHTKDDNSEIILYTPWDLDRTWGNGFDNEPYDVDISKNVIMKTNIAYCLLEVQDAEMMQRVVERYTQLRAGYWSDEQLSEMINEYEAQIFDSGAFARDKERWPDGWYGKEEDRLNVFERYVLDRMQYMDAYIGQYNN